MDKTQDILRDLWKFYGSRNLPAEWDGNVYGGGKMSQRFWEYMTTIQLSEFGENSVVLDVGGSGNGVDYEEYNGAGFLARVLSPHVKRVIVADPACKDGRHGNIYTLGLPAFQDSPGWERAMKDHLVTHITCVSVLEHIEQPERVRMLARMHEFASRGSVDRIVMTCEYHPTVSWFPHVLHTVDLSQCVSAFTDFYIDSYQSSPTLCVNALKTAVALDNKNQPVAAPVALPCWYPIAFRLRRGVPT